VRRVGQLPRKIVTVLCFFNKTSSDNVTWRNLHGLRGIFK